jgi:hypothetical protein
VDEARIIEILTKLLMLLVRIQTLARIMLGSRPSQIKMQMWLMDIQTLVRTMLILSLYGVS